MGGNAFAKEGGPKEDRILPIMNQQLVSIMSRYPLLELLLQSVTLITYHVTVITRMIT